MPSFRTSYSSTSCLKTVSKTPQLQLYLTKQWLGFLLTCHTCLLLPRTSEEGNPVQCASMVSPMLKIHRSEQREGRANDSEIGDAMHAGGNYAAFFFFASGQMICKSHFVLDSYRSGFELTTTPCDYWRFRCYHQTRSNNPVHTKPVSYLHTRLLFCRGGGKKNQLLLCMPNTFYVNHLEDPIGPDNRQIDLWMITILSCSPCYLRGRCRCVLLGKLWKYR